MRAILALALIFSIPGLKAQTIPVNDSVEIVAVIADWNNAWEIKDHKLASKGYSEDAKFTNAFGDSKNGRSEVEQLLKEVFSLSFVMSGHSITKEQTFQKLSESIVMVHTLVERTGQKLPDNTVLPKGRPPI
jgi:uncharacterized protein (TIGR02246 family)